MPEIRAYDVDQGDGSVLRVTLCTDDVGDEHLTMFIVDGDEAQKCWRRVSVGEWVPCDA